MPCFAVPSAVGRATIRVPRFVTTGTNQESAMGEVSPGTPPSVRASEDRLESWKEIAAYLNRDVTTVQRWEKREAMPVNRHLHDRMGSVYASRTELDAWARGRSLRAAQENGNDAVSPDLSAPLPHSAISTSRTRWKFVLLLTAAYASGCNGPSISGETQSRTHDFRHSPTSMAW